MPRRSSRPAGGRRPAPAPRRAASTRAASPRPPARRPAPPPAQAQKTAPAPAQKAGAPPPAQAAPPQSGAMGGFMANVASTGLGVMAGRAMDRAFFGGGSAQAAPEDLPPQEYQEPSYNEYAANDQEISPSVCAREALEFKKCMEKTSSDVAGCQWNFDVLAACQQQQQQTGFADAGRL